MPKLFEEMKQFVNTDVQSKDSLNFDFSDYEIIYKKEIITDIEADFSKRAKSGNPKEFYLYILRRNSRVP